MHIGAYITLCDAKNVIGIPKSFLIADYGVGYVSRSIFGVDIVLFRNSLVIKYFHIENHFWDKRVETVFYIIT